MVKIILCKYVRVNWQTDDNKWEKYSLTTLNNKKMSYNKRFFSNNCYSSYDGYILYGKIWIQTHR